MPEEISALAERQSHPGLVLALRRGVAQWNPAKADTPPKFLCRLDEDLAGNRCNDGKCDAQGRFWVGTMDFACTAPTGSLYAVSADGTAVRHDQGFAVTNGPTWLNDQRTMLFNDTVQGRVLAYDVEATTGQLSHRRTWLQLAPSDGVPDGMCTDAMGRVWICHWGGSCVSCHDPRDAKELGRIALPVSQVTSCAFGGADLRTLYVTSARVGLSKAALAQEPLAGGLFAFSVDAAGRLANRFGG
jgi:sugar lactone lactonase YvrE